MPKTCNGLAVVLVQAMGNVGDGDDMATGTMRKVWAYPNWCAGRARFTTRSGGEQGGQPHERTDGPVPPIIAPMAPRQLSRCPMPRRSVPADAQAEQGRLRRNK